MQLSSDAQFAERLRQAISTEPVIRQDKVDDARRKLETGALGQDADALAGRLIDHLLEG